MSDPLSVAASVAGLLSLTIQVSQLLYTQIHVIKHAPKDARDLLHEIEAIEGALRGLVAFLREHGIDEDNFSPNSMLSNAVSGCTLKIVAINSRVEKLNKGGLGSMLERGKWLYQKDERSAIISTLHRNLSIFQLSLSVEGLNLCLKSIHSFAQDIKAIQTAVQILSQSSQNSVNRITELLVPLYETSTGVLQISKTVTRWDLKQQERESQEMLDWLSPFNASAKQSDVLSQRKEGTGYWFTEHRTFKEWLNGPKNRMWCPGIPGAGKTVLSAVVIDHLHHITNDDNTGIAYFYCSYKEQNAQSTVNILASFAQQLIKQNPTPSEELTTMYRYHNKARTRPFLSECRSLLLSVLGTFSKTIIVLDALDETDEKSGTRAQLIAELKILPSSTKILITSRHCTSDEELFDPSSSIEIRAPESDIATYVTARMSEESRLTKHFRSEPTLAPLVLENVVRQAQGMFLLAELHMDAMVKKRSRKEVKQAFSSLPQSLDNTYEDVMRRIASQEDNDFELATKVLSWISYAVRPLNISELQHALATEESDDVLDPEALIDREVLASVCGGLVSIDCETATVRLIHYTAQEYFERHRDRIFPDAKDLIGRTCVTYLSCKAFTDEVLSQLMVLHAAERHRGVMVDGYPLLDYTVNHWGIHVRGRLEETLLSQIIQVLKFNKLLFHLVFDSLSILELLATYPRIKQAHLLEETRMLLIVADFGLLTVMGTLLDEKDTGRSSRQKRAKVIDYTPELVAFELATIHNHEAVARLMLRKRPEIADVLDKSGLTVFNKLAETENMMALRLLLDGNADVNKQNRGGSTALTAAAKRKSEFLVTWLLQNGANDMLNDSEDTALCAFVSMGDMSAAKLLLETGLRTNLTDDESKIQSKAKYINFALCAAGRAGDLGMLTMIFDVVYDLDIFTDVALFDLFDDGNMTSPLHCAAQSGSRPVTDYLIQKGLPINGVTENSWTPLHWAAERGRLEVAICLLQEAAQLGPATLQDLIDMQTANSQTALHKAAAKREYSGLVATLLAFRASVDLKMRNGNTALHVAAEKGNADILSLLALYTEAEEQVNDLGYSARDLAMRNGHLWCAEILSGDMKPEP